jgi:hypothetical protein
MFYKTRTVLVELAIYKQSFQKTTGQDSNNSTRIYLPLYHDTSNHLLMHIPTSC